MTTVVETLEGLERRIALTVSLAEIEREVERRLQRAARTAKLPGFRPGKVPMKMVSASYGPQIQSEVLGDQVSQAWGAAVQANDLRVAGQPRIEPGASEGVAEGHIAFNATFEVYPDVPATDLATLAVSKPTAEVGDAEIDRTIDILRKQRVSYTVVDRAAQADDRVTVDFVGKIDGVEFAGGKAEDFVFALGQGRMLPEFETAVTGLKTGEVRQFDLTFPDNYPGAEVAGKTAQFEATLKRLEEPSLPPVDADFAVSLGVPDGDLDKMRGEIRSNLEREVRQRLKSRTKSSVMEALLGSVEFPVPKALSQSEAERMANQMREQLKASGMPDVDKAQISADMYMSQAERRVRLGLFIADLVQKNDLNAKAEQVNALVEEMAQAYEQPADFVRWYLSDNQRVAEAEAVVIEDNVVAFVLSQAQVTEAPVTLEDLMAQQQQG